MERDDEMKPTGEHISPAFSFGHEIKHFLNRLKKEGRQFMIDTEVKYNPDNSYVDPEYHTPEEKDVIKEFDIPAAEKLKESIQDNHHGKEGRSVDSPTENPNSKNWKE